MKHAKFPPIFSIFLILIVGLGPLFALIAPANPSGRVQTSFPRSAASASSSTVFPSANAQLFANSPYNLTAGVRAPIINTNYDSANLEVEKEGSPYANESLAPLGTYAATYSFENDRAGGLAEGFTYSTPASTSATIMDSFLGHSKVLCLTDNNGTDRVYASQSVPVTSGNFSTWTLPTIVDKNNYIFTAWSGGGFKWGVSMGGSVFKYCADGGSWVSTGVPCASNRWYYVTISFTSTHVWVTVDGLQVAFFARSFTGAFDTWWTGTEVAETGYSLYVDAIDVSWGAGYVLNQNAVDLGQVGIYNATHSFENETMFAVPGGWTDASTGAGCRIYAAPAIATAATGHHNILTMTDASASYQTIAKTLTPITTTGSVEFWFYASQVTNNIFFLLWDLYGFIGPDLGITGGNLAGYSGGWVTLQAVSAATWYHVRVTLSVSTHTYDVRVNGILRGTNLVFVNATSTSIKMFQTSSENADQNWWAIDAFDWSGDPSYVSERSTYLFLNQTQTFPQPGSYSFRYQAWGSNVNYDSPWTPFTVVDNVQLNSEADVETRWVLTSSAITTTWNTLYSATFGAWTIAPSGGKNEMVLTSGMTGDTQTVESAPTNNYGTVTYNGVRHITGMSWDAYSHLEWNYPSGYETVTPTSVTLGYYQSYHGGTPNVNVYCYSQFDENALTWNNQVASGALITSYTVGSNDWVILNIAAATSNAIRNVAITEGEANFNTKEAVSNCPYVTYILPKLYQPGTLLMQTNATETLTTSSPTFGTLNLLPDDRISISFSTTSAHQVSFLTSYGGSTVTTRDLVSEGNTNFATQTKIYTLTAAETINGVNFTGLFEDKKNFKLSSITIERASYSGATPVQTYVAPLNEKGLSVPAWNYTLDIYEGADIKDHRNVTISTYSLNKFTYTPLLDGERVILYYEIAGKPLDYSLFWTNVTRTLGNVTSKFLSTIDRIFADDGSTITIETWDKFGDLLKNTTQTVSDFISITILDIYSVKIQNQMHYSSQVTLSRNYSYSQYLASNEIVEFQLFAGNYTLNYTNPELLTTVSDTLVVSSPMLYVLNTSFYNVYFSAFSNDGQGVPTDSVRLYCDYFRKEWGFVSLLGPNHNITVLDYFNDTVFSQVLDLSTYSEFNVFVNIAWMSLYNNNTQEYYTFSIVKNSTMLLTQAVAPQNFLLFRFTTGTYNVTAYYQNGSLFESHNITLAENSSNLLSFGMIAPDFTSVYASQLYNYALFRDLVSWSPNLSDDYAMFYPVQLTNYLNYTGTVFFEYLGTVTSITVSANQPYISPLYVPKGASYRLYNNGTASFLNATWTPVASNVTASGYVVLEFGFYSEKVPVINTIGPSVLDIYLFIGVLMTVSAVVLAVLYVNAKRKLARDESRGERARNRAGVSRQIR